MKTKVWKKDTTTVIPTDDVQFYSKKADYIAFLSGEESPHKHLIAAWSKGAPIEVFYELSGEWFPVDYPTWLPEIPHRIKEIPAENPRAKEILTQIKALEEELGGIR